MTTDLTPLSDLIEACRDGRFYDDYDHACELIGGADRTLAELARAQTESAIACE